MKFRDPVTGELLESPLAHVLAERMVQGLNDPEHYPTFVRMLYERDMREAERERKEAAGRGPNAPQIPRIIFLSPPHDPLAKPGDPPKAARILGQIEGPNGEIIDAQSGKVVVTAPQKSAPGDSGLGEGEEQLELVKDPPSVCLACSGTGRQRIGFGSVTEPCDDCGGTGRMQ